MNISTRGRYALQAMVILASNETHEPIPLKTIAEKAGVSEGYLQQLFINLRKAGLVIGNKGSQPGYVLAREGISVGDVLRVMETAFTTVDCVSDDDTCPRSEGCITRNIWAGLKNEIDGFVDGISLDHLAKCYQSETDADQGVFDYNI